MYAAKAGDGDKKGDAPLRLGNFSVSLTVKDIAKSREFYEKPTAERKRKLAAAVKRHYKRLRSHALPPKLY